MVQFNVWCRSANSAIAGHSLTVLTVIPANLVIGIQNTAVVVPVHYVAEENLSRVFGRLGKAATALLIQEKLPTTKQIRSGDLGEIFATEWIDRHSGGYLAPIKRLRWKDHRNMAMRGEDVIGLYLDPRTRRLSFLKTEAKSRARLTNQVLQEARAALDKDGGLPSAHAIAYISARLFELRNYQLSDAIDDALLNYGIPNNSVRHLLFTFSGNDPTTLLTASLNNYHGPFSQLAVGLYVAGHAKFVSDVYEQVIDNAINV